MIAEQWRPVLGHEGAYAVSNRGRVKSLSRIVKCNMDGGARVVSARILKPGKTKSGHVSVALGKGNSRLVHHLVLEAFVGPRPEGLEACHNNGIPDDNNLDNLRWDTRANNIRDKKWHGAIDGRKHKLSGADVVEIKKRLANGGYGINVKLAHEYGVTPEHISEIKHGKVHADVKVG